MLAYEAAMAGKSHAERTAACWSGGFAVVGTRFDPNWQQTSLPVYPWLRTKGTTHLVRVLHQCQSAPAGCPGRRRLTVTTARA